jgi:hypothetical protein
MKKTALIITLIMVFFTNYSFSMSTIEKAQKEYKYNLSTIRSIKVMVENFPDDGVKTKYADIQKKFQEASELFYGQKFSDSYIKFRVVKEDLIKLMQQLSKIYLDRTKEILDSTSKEAFDVIIKYGKNSGEITYFRRPFDPLYDVKPYNEKNYHFYQDRARIESFLKEGYKRYQDALTYFNDPEIEYIKNKKNISQETLNYIIDRYLLSIFLCRESKQLGIEIYKIGIKQEELKDQKNRLSATFFSGQHVLPIYDSRIPEKFKVDANDNIELMHTLEMQRANMEQPKKQEAEKK